MGLLAALAVTTACGTASPASTPSSSPSPSPIALEPTPWQAEILDLEPDGTRSLDSALTLFAMAFGPVPGVAATTAEAGTVGSASPAVRVIRERREEFTEEQRAAVDRYLTPSADSRTIEIPAGGTSTSFSLPGAVAAIGPVAQDDDPFVRDLKQLGEQARRAAAPYFGDMPNQPDGKPGLSIRTTYAPSEAFVTFFNPMFGPGGFEKCDVIVNSAHADLGLSQIGRPLTLDVVHCFQSWRMGSEQGFDGNVPAWAWEGPAEYIMLEAWPTQEDDALYWATYILLPDVPLFERAYDAYAYYAQARDAGVDLGAAFVAVLTDVDDPERFALAGTTSNQFLDKWASELIRSSRGDWGPDWTFVAPGPYGASPTVPTQAMSVANGSLEAFSQAAYSNHIFALNSAADIVKVDAFGRARVGDGTVDEIVAGSATFCITDKGCGPCPDGSDPTINPTPLAGVSVLAVSGGTDGTNGTVSGHPLEEFCQPTPKPTEDEFCKRWRALLDWGAQNTDIELTQPWAAEIARQSQDMRPFAPYDLIDDVDSYIRVYGAYASVPEPVNVPFVGPDAASIGIAFQAINDYCLAPQTPPPTPPPTPAPTPPAQPVPTPTP